MMLKLAAIGVGILLTPALALLTKGADEPAAKEIALWPSTPPGDNGSLPEDKVTKNREGKITSVTNVSKPTITVYRADPKTASGLAMVVCPGGGYNMLAWAHEGEQVAEWLNSIGITAVLLKYRVPRRADTPKGTPPPQALMDAQRAVALTRSRAQDWGIDPKRIGILGFSAGGHLSTWAATNAEKLSYEPVDESDKASARPDFAVVIYPGGVVKRGSSELAPEIRVDAQTPPMFIAMSNDDPVGPENAVQLYLALKRAKVPAELHIFATGGHGYGMRKSDNPASMWIKRCEEWMRNQKLLGADAR
jgi:acetyl esterase/lipase